MIASLYRRKLLRYGVIGGISTFIHMVIAFGWLYWVNDSIIIANILAFMISYVFSYAAQSKLVFKHSLNTTKALKYFIVQFSALWLSLGLSAFFKSSPYLKTLIILAIMPLITYIIHKFWTFAHPQENV